MGRIYSGCKLREEGEITSVQRKVVDILLIDDLTYRGVLHLQDGSGCRDFHRGLSAARFQGEIHPHIGIYVDDDTGLRNLLESLRLSVESIVGNSDRRERVGSLRSGRGGQSETRILISERDLGATDHRPRSILYRPGNGTRINLGMNDLRAQE